MGKENNGLGGRKCIINRRLIKQKVIKLLVRIMLLTTLLLTIYGHSSSGAKLLLFVKTERNNAPFFVKTERNDFQGRYQTHILNKSSIVTTLCTLPEYSLRDNEYVVTRVMCIEERHFVSSINVVSLWRKSASHDLSI